MVAQTQSVEEAAGDIFYERAAPAMITGQKRSHACFSSADAEG